MLQKGGACQYRIVLATGKSTPAHLTINMNIEHVLNETLPTPTTCTFICAAALLRMAKHSLLPAAPKYGNQALVHAAMQPSMHTMHQPLHTCSHSCSHPCMQQPMQPLAGSMASLPIHACSHSCSHHIVPHSHNSPHELRNMLVGGELCVYYLHAHPQHSLDS